jgi:hypothetical protein
MWFARARLGFSTQAIFAIGCNIGAPGEWTIQVSRVLEKSSLFAVAGIQSVLARLNLEGVEQISVWTDAGPS